MFNYNTVQSEEFAPDVVNSLKNSPLLSAIRSLLYSNNDRNRDAFVRTLLSSTLLVLTKEAPRTPKKSILNYNEEGYAQYGQDTQIPLVQLNSDIGALILPVFTESSFVHNMKGLNEFNGLAVSAQNILEMSLTAQSSAICINPGSQEFIMLERRLIKDIVLDLKSNAQLPQENLMTFNGHDF